MQRSMRGNDTNVSRVCHLSMAGGPKKALVHPDASRCKLRSRTAQEYVSRLAELLVEARSDPDTAAGRRAAVLVGEQPQSWGPQAASACTDGSLVLMLQRSCRWARPSRWRPTCPSTTRAAIALGTATAWKPPPRRPSSPPAISGTPAWCAAATANAPPAPPRPRGQLFLQDALSLIQLQRST